MPPSGAAIQGNPAIVNNDADEEEAANSQSMLDELISVVAAVVKNSS